ncbi:CDP-alcohol phosphatidyltransferase family protein [Patescibacteria group bacterium]
MDKQRLGWRFWLVQVLTYIRLPLMLIWGFIILVCFWRLHRIPADWFYITLVIMIVAAVTDLLDGWLARLFGVTTRLGAYGDPVMDKVYYTDSLLVLVALVCFQQQYGHAVLLICLTTLYLKRDHLVSMLRSIGALHNACAKAHWSGKLRTIISFPMIWIIYAYLAAPPSFCLHFPGWSVYTLEVVGIGLTLLSLYKYTDKFFPLLKIEFTNFDAD